MYSFPFIYTCCNDCLQLFLLITGISLYFDENTKVAYACSRIIGQDQSCILLNLACGKRLIQILKTKHMHRGNTHNRDATCRQSRNGKCKLEGNCCSNHRADEPILLPAKIMKMINQRCNGKHNCSFKNPVYDSCTPGDPEGTCYLSVDYDCIPGNYGQSIMTSY